VHPHRGERHLECLARIEGIGDFESALFERCDAFSLGIDATNGLGDVTVRLFEIRFGPHRAK